MPERQIALTPAGLSRLEEELRALQGARRAEVAERMRSTHGYGNRDEDPEYLVAREEQDQLEHRIAELKEILDQSIVLDAAQVPVDHVGLGSVVTVRELDGGEEWALTL